ncbi:MAG: glycosyltransferase family 9 protein [Bacteroidales bacterium]|nr:glycosyltransferase family 9 protein [Bacteroidales bacterium]
MKRLLITRFSAMGDVAMSVPVIKSLAENYKDLEIVVLSRKNFEPMFSLLPQNVKFCGVDLKNDYKGILGLNRLFKEIKNMKIDAYADFHDVLRTKYLRIRTFFAGIKTEKINKGRNEKKRLIKKGAENSSPLKTTFERYLDVLKKLGFDFKIDFRSIFSDNTLTEEILKITGEKKSDKWVGIAPFAAHKGKILPLETTEQTVKLLSEKGVKVFLFGAGKKEKPVLEEWEKKFSNTISTAGKLGGLKNELLLISNLDCMVSMDSANMHLASLTGTRVVSVWGATHPKAGFLGLNQKESDSIQIPLNCRPCSVYGNKECKINEKYKCLNSLKAEDIVKKILM